MFKKGISAFALLALVTSLCALAFANQDASVTLTGNIVDKQCATGRMKTEHPQEAIDKHTKKCSLMEACLKSGLGVYADGKFIEFDTKGTDLGKVALEKSEKANGAKFKVTGKMVDGKLVVTGIQEVQ